MLVLLIKRWLNPLFSKGYDRRLEPEDLYEVLQEDSSEQLVSDLERYIAKLSLVSQLHHKGNSMSDSLTPLTFPVYS